MFKIPGLGLGISLDTTPTHNDTFSLTHQDAHTEGIS